jgi:hypothetical protein
VPGVNAPDDVVDELYGAPFDEFTARRDARARELRKEGRREESDAVKALRKPALAAWAIDQLVRRDRDAVDELLAAGAALRQAKGGDTLRDATHEERDAVERAAERAAELLRDAGKTVTDKTGGELRDTLHAATLDDEVRDLLDRGHLVEARQAIGLGGFALPDVPAGGPGDAAKPKKKKSEKTKPAPAGKKAKRKDDRAERRGREKAAREAVREAERELHARERELHERERDVEAAERALARARADAEAAQGAVDEAREALEQRRADLDG